MKSISGYLGSGVLHGFVVVGLVAGAWFARDLTLPAGKPEGGPAIDLVPGPPGGTAGGPARPAPASPRTLPTVETLEADALLDRLNRARLAEERALRRSATAKPVASPASAPASSVVPVPVAQAHPSGDRFVPIVGARVDSPGPAVGPGGTTPAGARGGTGSAAADKAFAARVRERFAAVYGPLFESRGGTLQGSHDSGVVRLRVSATGIVAFVEWHVAPADARFEAIVRAAVAAMDRVDVPPSGSDRVLLLPVSGEIE